MAYDVFISHSRKDKPVADAICAALENAAIRCWIAPRDVQPGRSFAGEITRAVQECKAMVLVFSTHSNASEQVLREVQLAVKHHLHIVQFRIERVVLSDDFSYFLSTPHWLDALTPPLQAHLDRLTASMKTLLGPPSDGSAQNIPAEPQLPRRSTGDEDSEPPKPAEQGKIASGKSVTQGKRLAIAGAILLLMGAGATAAWWVLSRTQSAPPVAIPMVATPAKSDLTTPRESPRTPAPAPTVTESKPDLIAQATQPPPVVASPKPVITASPSPVERKENSPEPALTEAPQSARSEGSLADVLGSIGSVSGNARYQAIVKNVSRLPDQITVSDLLAIIKDSSYRHEVIKLMESRLPNPLSVKDFERVLGATSGNERYQLIEMLGERLPEQITVDDLLSLIKGTSYRNDAVKRMVSRLPAPLSVKDFERVLGATSGNERYLLIQMLVERLPQEITVDDLLGVIKGSSYRNDAVKLMVSRLPNPLSVADLERILGSTSGNERYALIGMLHELLPAQITVDDLLAVTKGTSYRNEAIQLLVSRLPNPTPAEDMLRILGSISGNERYGLIKIIAPLAPAGLSQAQLTSLIQGSAYASEAEKMLKR